MSHYIELCLEKGEAMESIIIYGVGNTGKNAYAMLKDIYNILFFIDM